MTGLNLIHTTNLDYFTTQHQAEIFRLKGQFLQVRHNTQCILCWLSYGALLFPDILCELRLCKKSLTSDKHQVSSMRVRW